MASSIFGGLAIWPGILLDNEGNNMSLKAISTEDAAKLKLPHAEAISQYNAILRDFWFTGQGSEELLSF